MKCQGIIVSFLLVIPFASIGIPCQSLQGSSLQVQSYQEDHEEVDSFEDPEIWIEDQGVTFKDSISRNTSSDMDDKGNIDVVWEDDRGDDWNIFYVKLRNRDGEKLINDFRVTDNEDISWNPQIATQDEYIYIVWQEYLEGSWDLHFSKLRYSEEEITQVIERVELLELGNSRPKEYSFIKGENRHFHLVYEKEEEDRQDIYYVKINTEGSLLMEPQSITDTPDISYKPQIQRSNNGYLHILWLEPIERNNGIFYKQIDTDVNTRVDRKRLTVVKNLTRYDVTVDEEGSLHLIFDDDRYHDYKRDVIYQRLDGSGNIDTDDSLITPRGDDNNSFSPTITLEGPDEIHVTWADSRDYRSLSDDRLNITQIPHEIYTTVINSDGEKLRPEKRLTGSFSFSTRPLMITDEDNEQHLLWEDDRREVRDIYYKRTMKPDLAVENITAEPDEPLYNSTVSVEVLLKNYGGSRIDTTGSLYLENEDQILSQVNISIGPGKEQSFTIEFITREKGQQTLIFAANEEREETEKNYDQNRKETTFFTRYYDLSMTPVRENITLLPDERGIFQYNVTNEGNAPQDIGVDLNVTGPEEGIEIEHPPLEEKLEAGETRGYEFNATPESDQLAGEYTIRVTIESLETERVDVSENFTLEVEPVYDLSLYIEETTISDPAEINYTVDMTVNNLANTDQEIWVYIGEGNEYAHVEGGMVILEPGETTNPILNISGYHLIEGEELEITVIAGSQDDPDVMESETVLIEGEEDEEESLLASIPWVWIGIAVGLIVGVFIAFRVIYTVVYS